MSTTRNSALEGLSFGQRVAEEEVKDLAKYFVETEQWRRISSGEVDVVYGPKGAGKSALYALLLDRADSFFDRNIVMVSGENPRGTTVFKDLVDDPPTSEREFVNLWKLYFLSLVGSVLHEYASRSDSAKEVVSALEEAHLLSANTSSGLKALLRAVVDYVRRTPSSLEGELKLDPIDRCPSGTRRKNHVPRTAARRREARQGVRRHSLPICRGSPGALAAHRLDLDGSVRRCLRRIGGSRSKCAPCTVQGLSRFARERPYKAENLS